MEDSPEFDGYDASDVVDEPLPAVETSPRLDPGDMEESSQLPESTTCMHKKMKEVLVKQKVDGEDGPTQKEAHVRRKVGIERKDGEGGEKGKARQEKGYGRKEIISSTILVSVAVVAVVGAIIAKLARARKPRGS